MEDFIPEFDTREVISGYSTYNTGEKLRVRFYEKPILNDVATAEKGEDVFDVFDYCQIRIPGSRDIWDQPVREEDKKRFADEYARFKAGQKGLDLSEITSLKDWAVIDPARFYELVGAGFITVEEVANCPDGSIGKLGADGVMLRKKAQAFVANKQANSSTGRIKELEDKMASLMSMNEVLLKKLEEKEGTKKGK